MKNLLGVLLIGCAALISTARAADEPVKAINFQFTDISGKSIQLSDFKGKWVLVNFWAPWCPLCWVEVPSLNELNKRHDFVVIGVGLDYGPDEGVVRDTAMRHNLEFRAVVAGGARRNQDSPFRQVGPVDFYPTSYIYDPNGEIVMFIPGQVRLNRIIAFMDEYKSKNSQFAEGKSSAQTPPINDVTYSKPESSPSHKATQTPKKGSKTVTY